MQKVRGHSTRDLRRGRGNVLLPLFVGTRFQVLFHSPFGVLFTFPSRYSFTIGQYVVLSLGGWSPQIPPGFLVSEGTQEHHWPALIFAYGSVTLYPVPFQTLLLISAVPLCESYNPTPETWSGLGYTVFARRYLRCLN